MKSITTLSSCLIFGLLSFSQDYTPFHSPTKFVELGGNNEEFFFPEETNINGSLLEIKQYQKKSDSTIDVDNNNFCLSWGGMADWSFAGWLGRSLNYDQSAKTLAIDSLINFDFNLSIGDSSLFYSDGMHEYYIRYVSKTEEQVLNHTDSVRNYAIETYNSQGSFITNLFSTRPIQIAKELGAIQFIDLSDFPNTQKEYEIIGQSNTNLGHLGNYGLTYDDAFPWDVGDTIQCYGSNVLSNGGESSYVTYTITNRTETADSVFISLNKKIYHTVSIGGQSISDTTDLSYNIIYDDVYAYKKNKLIGDKPHQYLGFGEYYTNDISIYEKYDVSTEGYCDSCNCFTNYDAYLQNFTSFAYEEDFGLTMRKVEVFGDGVKEKANLVYARVGNNVYGSYVTASINENQFIDFEVYPNPAKSEIKINAPSLIQQVEIHSLDGRLSYSSVQNKTQTQIDLSNLDKGVYILSVTFENGQTTSKRIVKM